jgi:hypothetical protein
VVVLLLLVQLVFFSNTTVDAANLKNTYINFKYAGTNNDWCYLLQIGGDSAYKLAFDFHDDEADARFCILKFNHQLIQMESVKFLPLITVMFRVLVTYTAGVIYQLVTVYHIYLQLEIHQVL